MTNQLDRCSSKRVLWLFTAILAVGAWVRPAAGATFYVDIKNAQCSDTVGSGTQTRPYCSVNYAATIARPGDTFLIQSGKYNPGPTNFTRSGTATAPITYRAVGTVTFATEFVDENLRSTSVPNVYSMPNPSPGSLVQTRFPPILVDDPNSSEFTMIQEDGPMRLSPAPDEATLARIDGTYMVSGGVLRVHPYGNVVPSAAGTDILSAGGNANFNVSADYNVFDGFTIIFSANLTGANNTYLNMKFQTQPFILGGSNGHVENLSVTHVISRMADGDWLWHWRGAGTAAGLRGPGHRLKNIHLFHSWNADISIENAGAGVVIDGIRAHGAPNHCGSGAGRNVTVRNAVLYNCQDYIWMRNTNNAVLEHFTAPTGIGVESVDGIPLGPIIVRNSILTGSIVYVRGPDANCTWERGSILENNIISTAATIQRCGPAPRTTYPILTYMAKCERGELTDCMTIRNNQLVGPTEWRTIIKDGMWNASLGDNWDVHLVANSRAINAGKLSGTTRDIDGVARPQGSAPDIGIYEWCTSGNCPQAPPPTSSACDINRDTITNIMDVQLCVNQSLGFTSCTADINHDGRCDILDVQRVGNAALYGSCLSS